MKFLLDTAEVAEVRHGDGLGMVDGVTTNPSLPPTRFSTRPAPRWPGPWAPKSSAPKRTKIIWEGRELASVASDIVVKIPVTADGLKVTRRLKERRGDPRQHDPGVFAHSGPAGGQHGGRLRSPFVGRLDNISQAGMDLARQIMTIYRNYTPEAEIIVASIRNPLHVVDAAVTGAHTATRPFSVMTQFRKRPLSDLGLQRFLADGERLSRSLEETAREPNP